MVKSVANVDPHSNPEVEITYIDIASIDRLTKSVASPKSMRGKEAPSRARRLVRTDDVLVSTTRPNLNAVAKVSPPLDGAVCSTGFCVLRANSECRPDYLFYMVQSPRFVDSMTEQMTGASYPAVTDGVVHAFEFPLPPLGEQRRIVADLEAGMADAERARRAAEAQLAAAEALPSAILRGAFAGEAA